jgi:hypothetical protein
MAQDDLLQSSSAEQGYVGSSVLVVIVGANLSYHASRHGALIGWRWLALTGAGAET